MASIITMRRLISNSNNKRNPPFVLPLLPVLRVKSRADREKCGAVDDIHPSLKCKRLFTAGRSINQDEAATTLAKYQVQTRHLKVPLCSRLAWRDHKKFRTFNVSADNSRKYPPS